MKRWMSIVMYVLSIIGVVFFSTPTLSYAQPEEVSPIPTYADWVESTEFLFVSDSLLIGTADHLKVMSPKSKIDAVMNRQLINPPSDEKAEINDALEASKRTNGPVVFIALGLDQPTSMRDVEVFMEELLEEDSVMNIVFVTSGSQGENKNNYNSSVKEIATTNQHVYVVDFDAVAEATGYSKVYEKDKKYLLHPDQFYSYVLENTYEQMTEKMPLVTQEEFIKVPAPKLVEFDPSIGEGRREVTQNGEEGQTLIQTTYHTFMGTPIGSPQVEEVVVRQAVPEITHVGPGVETEEVVEEIKVIPFKTKTVENDLMDEGVARLIQSGTPGTLSIKKTTKTVEGNSQGEPVIEERVLTEAVDEIIEVGIGQRDVRVSEESKEIPFEVEYLEDNLLLEGDEVIAQEGVVGELRITTQTPLFNGEVVGDPVVTEKVIAEPITKVVRVGTASKEDAMYDTEGEIVEGDPFPMGIVVGLISLVGVVGIGFMMYKKFTAIDLDKKE